MATFLFYLLIGVPLAYGLTVLPRKAWAYFEAHSDGLTGEHAFVAAFLLAWAVVAWL